MKQKAKLRANDQSPARREVSIVRDVNLHILMAVAMIAILAVAISYFFLLNITHRQLETTADEYIDTIPKTLTPSLWTLDQQGAQSIARAFANNDLLAYILVTQARKEPFCHHRH